MNITLTREEAQQVLDAMEEIYWPKEHQAHKEIETLRARLSAPEPNYRDVVIKGDLWRIEFLPDHAASVVLVRANYEAQPEPPCKTGSQCIGGKCPQCVVSEPEPIAYKVGDATVYIKPPIYNAPPQREWKELTTAETKALWSATKKAGAFAALISAKLKEKNNG